MHGGSGAMGSSFFLLPQAMSTGLVSGGVVGVSMGIVMGIPSFLGGRDCQGTSSGGCKYQTGIASTILLRVSIAATLKASIPGGG
jgi:hypothetical protein